MLSIYRDETGNRRIKGIAKKLQGYVDEAAEKAYRIGLLDSRNPKLSQWSGRANEYLKTTKERMLPAYYGYAVEELTNNKIKELHGVGIDGYTILLQSSEGHTRPDITLKDASGKKVAWIDITSEKSKGHIYRKDSKGWRSKPFVAELTYKTFKKTKIVPGNGSKKEQLKARLLQKRLKLQHKEAMNYFMDTFHLVMRELRKSCWPVLTQSRVALEVERCFDQKFIGSRKHPIIKSMIEMHSAKSKDAVIFAMVKKLYRCTKRDKAGANAYIYKAYKNKCKKNN